MAFEIQYMNRKMCFIEILGYPILVWNFGKRQLSVGIPETTANSQNSMSFLLPIFSKVFHPILYTTTYYESVGLYDVSD